jgi:hypothetical protein
MNAIAPERNRVREGVRSGGLFPWAGYAFVVFFLAALAAFWPEYLSGLPRGGFYKHFHASLMTLWFGLLIAQPLLIRAGRRPLHRILGRSSFVVAPLAIVSMVLLTHARVHELPTASTDAYFAVLPLAMATLFTVAYALAIGYRHQPALHARYMICTGLALVDPVGARLIGFYLPFAVPGWAYQGTTFTLTDLFLAWLIWRERHALRGRAAFPVILAVAIILQAAVFVLPYVPAWQAAIRWFAGLPLT